MDQVSDKMHKHAVVFLAEKKHLSFSTAIKRGVETVF